MLLFDMNAPAGKHVAGVVNCVCAIAGIMYADAFVVGTVNNSQSSRAALQCCLEKLTTQSKSRVSAPTEMRFTLQSGAYRTRRSEMPSGKCGLRRCTEPIPTTCA